MEKLDILISRCKCEINLTINSHRNIYQTVDQYFEYNNFIEEDLEDIDIDVYEKMKELDTIVELQFYPSTPIGFHKIYHYDLNLAIDEALELINKDLK